MTAIGRLVYSFSQSLTLQPINALLCRPGSIASQSFIGNHSARCRSPNCYSSTAVCLHAC